MLFAIHGTKAEFTVFANQGIPLTKADSFAYWLTSFNLFWIVHLLDTNILILMFNINKIL